MKYLQNYGRQEIWRDTAPILQRHIQPEQNRQINKGQILPFPKKGDLRISKNYWGITLTSIADKVYNAQALKCIEPKIKKF